MNVSQCMNTDVRVCSPDVSLRDGARLMRQLDAGLIPIGENDRLVGTVTDRDMAVRGLAEGHGPDTPLRQVMTQEIAYCFEDDDVQDAARQMGEYQLRRLLLVLNRDKRLVGVISLGDIAQGGVDGPDASGDALRDITQPGGDHRQ